MFEGVPTRATGTPGHEASVEYVVEMMEAAGFDVTLQPFEADIFFEQSPAAFEQISPEPDRLPRYDGENGVWYTADFSGDGDVTAEAVVVDFTEPTTQAERLRLRLRGGGLRRPRCRRQDRAPAARHLRLRPEGRDRAARPAPSARSSSTRAPSARRTATTS